MPIPSIPSMPSVGGPRRTVFSPASLSPALWLRADSGTWQNSAGTTPATADGDPVGRWSDQSGSGNHVTQGTSGNRPTLKVALVNGQPAIRFDAVNDSLAATFARAQPRTVMLVFQPRTWAAGRYVFDGAGSDEVYVSQAGSTTHYGVHVGGSGFDDLVVIATSTWHLLTAVYNGASSKGAVDGGTPATGTVGGTGATGFRLASQGGGTNLFTAIDVAEVLEWGRVLTAEEQASMVSYAQGRYATP